MLKLCHKHQGFLGLFVGQGSGFLVWVCQKDSCNGHMTVKDNSDDFGPALTKVMWVFGFFCSCETMGSTTPRKVSTLFITCGFQLQQFWNVASNRGLFCTLSTMHASMKGNIDWLSVLQNLLPKLREPEK